NFGAGDEPADEPARLRRGAEPRTDDARGLPREALTPLLRAQPANRIGHRFRPAARDERERFVRTGDRDEPRAAPERAASREDRGARLAARAGDDEQVSVGPLVRLLETPRQERTEPLGRARLDRDLERAPGLGGEADVD